MLFVLFWCVRGWWDRILGHFETFVIVLLCLGYKRSVCYIVSDTRFYKQVMDRIMRPEMRDAESSELHEGLGVSGCADPSLTEREKAVIRIREILKPGDTVTTVLRHVSRSGMTRHIDAYVFRDGEPRYLSYLVNEVLGWGMSQRYEGVKVGGCGMDVGFHLVYSLSYALYGSGYECIQDEENKVRCPSNYHVNSRDWTKYNGLHTDGYALKHRWL